MDTKWKNMTDKGIKIVKVQWKTILSVIAAACGIFAFYIVIAYRGYHPTGEAIFFSLIGNLFFGAGAAYLLIKGLREKYKSWEPEGAEYYQEWMKEIRKIEKTLHIAGAAGLAAAFWYLSFLMGGNYWSGYYGNYASAYMLIITVFVQYIWYKTLIRRFGDEKLNGLLEQVEEINKKRIAEALELEKKSLAKVSRSDQLRVDLITNVSHDLKTPLTSMVGYIELIKKEELSDVVRDYVDVLSDRADKLKEMINSLFSLAKASSGNVELHPEKFEMNRLIDQIFADMDDHIKNSGLTFVTQLTDENTEIVSDNMYFYRICQNLIENALKYSAKGTRVFVKTYRKNGKDAREALCLEITNTAGYPMDFTKEDIVERFSRGDKARSSDGNGLGLAIVSTYAKALGGEFDIKLDCDQFKACVKMPLEYRETR